MGHNAFSAGVAPGGLTRDYEIKIMICYLLNKAECPVTFAQLNDSFQKDQLMNYFEFAEAMSQLLTLGNIALEKTPDGKEVYVLTPLGKNTAETFYKSIPLSVREKAVKQLHSILIRERRERENHVEIIKVSDGYKIILNIKDVGSDLLSVSLFVPTMSECEKIKERFLNDPAKLYQGMIALLTGEDAAAQE